jgi:ADP-ribose pyrophosphatase
MTSKSTLDRPDVTIDVVKDETSSTPSDAGFVRVRRLTLRNRYGDGSEPSRDYPYDCVERDATDAVGIVLYARTPDRVCVRSAIRPPLALRPGYALPLAATQPDPTLFEIPAGLVEAEERGEEGLRACAARETMEEVGLAIAADAFFRLGPGVFLSPGLSAEKLYFLAAEADPESAGAPTLDGSPVEDAAVIRWLTLADALEACRTGAIEDAKTEVAIRRLAEHLADDEGRATDPGPHGAE